jgi:hypothetical protein
VQRLLLITACATVQDIIQIMYQAFLTHIMHNFTGRIKSTFAFPLRDVNHIFYLLLQQRGFSDILNDIEGISNRMLSKELKELEIIEGAACTPEGECD